MDEGVVEKLIEFVENASPVVWEAALKQVRVNAIGNFILALIGIGVIVLCLLAIKWLIVSGDDGDSEDEPFYGLGIVVFVIIGVAASIFAICNVYDGIARFINPNWYAIQNLLSLVP